MKQESIQPGKVYAQLAGRVRRAVVKVENGTVYFKQAGFVNHLPLSEFARWAEREVTDHKFDMGPSYGSWTPSPKHLRRAASK